MNRTAVGYVVTGLVVAALTAAALAIVVAVSTPAQGAARAPLRVSQGQHSQALTARHRGARRRVKAMRWARTQQGKPYKYGAEGPHAYDCSGLVYKSYLHVGIRLPRTTYAMLRSRHLVRIRLSRAKKGDLLFYGRGHVELATKWYHESYGAQKPGTRVGYHTWGGSWHPTRAYRVR